MKLLIFFACFSLLGISCGQLNSIDAISQSMIDCQHKREPDKNNLSLDSIKAIYGEESAKITEKLLLASRFTEEECRRRSFQKADMSFVLAADTVYFLTVRAAEYEGYDNIVWDNGRKNYIHVECVAKWEDYKVTSYEIQFYKVGKRFYPSQKTFSLIETWDTTAIRQKDIEYSKEIFRITPRLRIKIHRLIKTNEGRKLDCFSFYEYPDIWTHW